ncbi:hypothetical protein [Cryobacterium sp. Y57]|uniref:hypothetical protein n=1 Tax=Cryobacterium sp. Y57 TaxID=2048287 RepID=UPI000CE44E38|nr:hypothetical protein [Cryobacterium sp. Y57]
MLLLKKLVWPVFGSVMLALSFLAATRVPIVGDDFQALQEAFVRSGGDLAGSIAYGWTAGMQAGHFNPVGQLLGAVYHFAAYEFSVVFQITPQFFHVASSLGLIWLTTLAASYVVVCAAKFVRNTSALPLGPIFALVATITGLTLQIHPWSNDPVTTYSMAGFGSAAVAFLLLALALRALSPGTSRWGGPVAVAVVSVFAVLYYEMLVAAVAATAVVYVGAILPRADRTRSSVTKSLLLLLVGVALPAIVFVGGRFLAAPAVSSGYTGTSVALGPDALRTWVFSMVSTLPGGAWPYSMYRIDPLALSRSAVVVAGLLCLGVIGLAIIWWKSTPVRLDPTRRLWVPAGALFTLWALSVAAHAVTPKYISEITSPGLVYLFYAVGVVCAAVFLAVVILILPRTALLKTSMIALPLLCAFVVVQQAVNWTLGDLMRSAYSSNAQLAAVSTNETSSEAERCAALQLWLEKPWPQYYEESVTTNVELNFEASFDDEFCGLAIAVPAN